MAVVTVAVLTLLPVGRAQAAAGVPSPKPRPAAAPAAPAFVPSGEGKSKEAEKDSEKDAEKDAVAPAVPIPQPSACRVALTEAIAIAPSIPDIHGPGGCGGEDLVRLEAVVLPDHRQVAVKPAAVLRCRMASAVADWVRSDVAPLAKSLGTAVTDLDNFDAFECRSRNRIAGAKLSEHGRGNALDIRSFKFANGRTVALTDRNVPRDLREAVLHSACARFSTVLGPGSDGYHEDHIHLDLMERRNDYRTCQWSVWDPLPAIAPMLPLPRPVEAPPRIVAETPEEAAARDSEEADDDAKPSLADHAADRAATKKRR